MLLTNIEIQEQFLRYKLDDQLVTVDGQWCIHTCVGGISLDLKVSNESRPDKGVQPE